LGGKGRHPFVDFGAQLAKLAVEALKMPLIPSRDTSLRIPTKPAVGSRRSRAPVPMEAGWSFR
jgi:hypothetical protein